VSEGRKKLIFTRKTGGKAEGKKTLIANLILVSVHRKKREVGGFPLAARGEKRGKGESGFR